MTGGQDVTGLMDVPALTRSLAAEGVGAIVVCAGRGPLRAPRRLAAGRGAGRGGRRGRAGGAAPSGRVGAVYDQRCAAEARRLRKRACRTPPSRVVINEAVCEGCGDCSVKSNCLSVLPVDTEFGEQARDPPVVVQPGLLVPRG